MPVLTINGCALNYEEVSAGEPFAYLAYTRYDSAKLWAPFFAEHASGFRVILPDPRGMAGSARVSEMKPQEWVSDLAGLFEALSLPPVHLCAETLGTRIATRFAVEHPDRVRTLILNAPIAYSSSEGDTQRGGTAETASMPQDRQDMMRRMHGDDWADVNRFYQELHQQADFKEYYDLREIAPQVKAPTLIIRGDVKEPVHPVAHAAILHERIPNCWLAIFPNTHFNALRTRPQESWARIREFIAANT